MDFFGGVNGARGLARDGMARGRRVRGEGHSLSRGERNKPSRLGARLVSTNSLTSAPILGIVDGMNIGLIQTRGRSEAREL